jgi:hypothetical protein
VNELVVRYEAEWPTQLITCESIMLILPTHLLLSDSFMKTLHWFIHRLNVTGENGCRKYTSWSSSVALGSNEKMLKKS